MHFESENCVTTERWIALEDTSRKLTMRGERSLEGQKHKPWHKTKICQIHPT